MRRRFRNKKISKDMSDDITMMLRIVCSDDEDGQTGESIIQDLEAGRTDDIAVEIASFMAQKTAGRFMNMVSGKRYSDVIQMLEHIQEADSIGAVRSIQMMLLSHGMTAESEDLDILPPDTSLIH